MPELHPARQPKATRCVLVAGLQSAHFQSISPRQQDTQFSACRLLADSNGKTTQYPNDEDDSAIVVLALNRLRNFRKSLQRTIP